MLGLCDGFHWWVDFRGGDSVVARLGSGGGRLGVGWVSQWRSGLGFNSISSSSVVGVSVSVVVGVESGRAMEIRLGLTLNRLC